ncbi:DMT family transporter [Bacillus alveayuensis]|jgi:drug/metabolite transporter (DMT)-like permease|uniref:DMT family transporter n=1 Tax=Aeribacillus alveayuensis TaxID=279215 RepID=UPI0005D12C7C|nr:DMT family transporter [Bacillus alveayuensis]
MSKPILYVSMLLLMMIWGFNVIAIKIIVEYFAPITITAFRILTAGLTVMFIVWIGKEYRNVTKMEWVYIVIASLTGVLGHHFFLAVGLANTTASNAGLILGLVPLMTTVFSVLLLGDHLTISKVLGILLGFFGVAFIVLNGNGRLSSISIGDLYIFFSVISQAISFIFIKKGTRTLHSRFMTGWMLVIGSVCLFMTSLMLEPKGLSTLQSGTSIVWIIFLGSAVIATALGHSFYNKAIHHLGPGETAIFINLTPFFSLVGSYFFLGEQISLLQLAGFIFILFGVLLGTGVLGNERPKIKLHKKRHTTIS